jgi:hypothetical protein
LQEAEDVLAACLDLDLSDNDFLSAAITTEILSDICLSLGKVTQAVERATTSARYANMARDSGQIIDSNVSLANALLQSANPSAGIQFGKAIHLRESLLGPSFQFSGKNAALYCDYLLHYGKASSVLGWASMVGNNTARRSKYDLATVTLASGRAFGLLFAHGDMEARERASKQLDEAVVALREIGKQDNLARGLLARARFLLHVYSKLRESSVLPLAEADLAEVQEIVEYGNMKLLEIDLHIERACLCLVKTSHAGVSLFEPSLNPPMRNTSRGLFARIFGKGSATPQSLATSGGSRLTEQDATLLAEAVKHSQEAELLIVNTGGARRRFEVDDLRAQLRTI